MPNETITITIGRYEELLHKEAVYDIQQSMVASNSYRTDFDACMYGVLTREEEKQLESERQTFKEWLDNNAKMAFIKPEEEDF